MHAHSLLCNLVEEVGGSCNIARTRNACRQSNGRPFSHAKRHMQLRTESACLRRLRHPRGSSTQPQTESTRSSTAQRVRGESTNFIVMRPQSASCALAMRLPLRGML